MSEEPENSTGEGEVLQDSAGEAGRWACGEKVRRRGEVERSQELCWVRMKSFTVRKAHRDGFRFTNI